MANAALYLRECRAEFRSARRMPEFALPTILLPIVFYILFAVVLVQPGSNGPQLPLLATFGVYAALGPAIFGFGVGLANERAQGLLDLKRVSPMPAGAILAAKLFMCAVFAGAIAVVLHVLASTLGHVVLAPGPRVLLFAVQVLSVLPFACIGILLGLLLRDQGSMAAANAVFFLLAILGGLWMPIAVFPGWLQNAALVLPSYHAGALALHAAGLGGKYPVLLHVAILAIETVLLAAAAIWAWQRRVAAS
jgi:ABC-2 type transport system permease protein